MSKHKKNKNSGITLIALVVTIIVLLILAGISIQMLSGNNGILKRAGEAKTNTEIANAKEQAKLDILSWQSYKISKNENSDLDDNTIKEILTGKSYVKVANDTSFITTKGEYEIPYSDLYKSENDNNKVEIAVEEVINSIETNGDIKINLSILGKNITTNPPLPNNTFSHVEGTILDGYVISDGTNEFVWIPVAKDQVIKLDINANKDIDSIKLYNPLGVEFDLGINGNIGTTFQKEITTLGNSNCINGAYKVEVKAADKTESEILVVRSLYAKDTFSNDYVPDIYTEEYCLSDEVINEWKAKTGNASSKEELYSRRGIANDAEFVTFVRNEAMPVIYTDSESNNSTSVNNNAGFYIGRYEAGISKGNKRTSGNTNNTDSAINSIKNTNGVPVSKSGQTVYNYVTQPQAKALTESMYTNGDFTCTLLTGAAWDRTLGFLTEGINSRTLYQIADNSGDWGNYAGIDEYDATIHYGSIKLTGSSEYWKSKNIFDIAGNICEWTTEIKNSNLVGRGGGYAEASYESPSSKRMAASSTFYYDYIGFRPAIYLKDSN